MRLRALIGKGDPACMRRQLSAIANPDAAGAGLSAARAFYIGPAHTYRTKEKLMNTRTLIGAALFALAIAATGLTAPAASAAPPAPEAGPESAAGVLAASCASWTDYTTGTGYHVAIPSTTRNGRQTDCVLGDGNVGPGVFILQDALRRCYGQPIDWDAKYGPDTRDAVKAVQAFHRFRPEDIDGIYGPQTRAAMTFPKYRDSDNQYDHCWR